MRTIPTTIAATSTTIKAIISASPGSHQAWSLPPIIEAWCWTPVPERPCIQPQPCGWGSIIDPDMCRHVHMSPPYARREGAASVQIHYLSEPLPQEPLCSTRRSAAVRAPRPCSLRLPGETEARILRQQRFDLPQQRDRAAGCGQGSRSRPVTMCPGGGSARLAGRPTPEGGRRRVFTSIEHENHHRARRALR